ncbi:response regulator transcription factor [Clostridium swellfunianum]|uniref:response regulator transcription factor n=1 Tax=Clostridium swellfunianum TaxID=1367462 RepID=UPI002030BB88|nr:response regulator transcription factor [Clostridium swellfunianum]MCM0650103.1 response regulator transcription factor [Clostridium swellfunianum]
MFSIMIVEDNEQLQNEIGNLLTRSGYRIMKTMEFDKIPKLVKESNPHLILLDINLPQDDGFKICTEIRSFSTVPIIFITSRDTNVDELMSITLGGDDFITKPYNAQILLARINSLLKRAYPDEKAGDFIEYNGVKLNILSSKVEYRNKEIELTKNELKILHYLLINKGKIVSRVDIMEYLWDSALFVNDNTLTVNITRLRNKFEDVGISEFIKTKRGQGYIV